MSGNLHCDWCEIPASELRLLAYPQMFGPIMPDNICADCYARQGADTAYTALPMSDRAPQPTYDDMIAFVEELRDHKPEIISGRRRDPQDDQDDMMSVEEFGAFQADAAKLVGKRKKVTA